ncbi:ribonucleoside-diphosphate reductase subunit alpha [Ensifer sp. ENS04]|uniref:ribonucleoside-diphosphate reductase subunit alpha n=1 Tax=Ensifer sp. ENS04 TaxID=2769281 RepID=UPI00178356BF|nr:ribonucleoside-diphosphate reductase subunit alpha [Ensifer sp. ENS04]MBD9544232.1 ribonucleoside-diphosphate reductase subunit alpha [Ensifer sp. ENS04]
MTSWITDDTRKFLSRGYLREGQTVEDRIAEVGKRAGEILDRPDIGRKVSEYLLNGWMSLSSPIWSNFGAEKALPISCNNVYIEDSIVSIFEKLSEVGIQTKYGAGTSGYYGALRPRGADISGGFKSFGAVHFMQLGDTVTNVVSQSTVRRGAYAVYLPADHGDIDEHLTIRQKNSPLQNVHPGVCITDKFLEEAYAGNERNQSIFAKILQRRAASGRPYIFFHDNANRFAADVYRDQKRTIWSSNLCTEVMLPSTAKESFVCNLLSLNALHYDDWKDTDLVKVAIYLLDAVMSEYINKTKDLPFMDSSYRFALHHRALGLGILGWHSLLQSKLIPFESAEAAVLNVQIFRQMQAQSYEASEQLGKEYGVPEMLLNYKRRNATTMAVAPTKSSAWILGQASESIQPIESNYFVQDLQKGKFTFRNPYLQKVLGSYGRDDEATWRSILLKGGSAQHLDFLTQRERDVFKTFSETDQNVVIEQAAARQRFIDQGQSLNLKLAPTTTPRDQAALVKKAHAMGLKSLYYQESTNPSQALARENASCVACEA